VFYVNRPSVFCALVVALFGSPVMADDGREIYQEYCSICHGMDMPGVPQFGDRDHWESRKEKGMEALYNATIYGVNAMPPMGLCEECSEEQIKAAVDYMVNSSR